MTNGKLQQWKSMFLSLILLFGLASIASSGSVAPGSAFPASQKTQE